MISVDDIYKLAEGNPGAMTFLQNCMAPDAGLTGLDIIFRLRTLKKIVGTDLYVLWSDLCNRDLNKVHALLIKCPEHILVEACSRQDYSGKELVKEYLV